MISKEEAKELLAKFYLQGELSDEELSALNEYAKKTTYKKVVFHIDHVAEKIISPKSQILS
jgi:hypothetical protein